MMPTRRAPVNTAYINKLSKDIAECLLNNTELNPVETDYSIALCNIANDYMGSYRKEFIRVESKYSKDIWALGESIKTRMTSSLTTDTPFDASYIQAELAKIKERVKGELRTSAFKYAIAISNKIATHHLDIVKGSLIAGELAKPDKGIINIDTLKRHLKEYTLPLSARATVVAEPDPLKNVWGTKPKTNLGSLLYLLGGALVCGDTGKLYGRMDILDTKAINDFAFALAEHYVSPARRQCAKAGNSYRLELLAGILKETINECLSELYPDTLEIIDGVSYTGFYSIKYHIKFAEPFAFVETY